MAVLKVSDGLVEWWELGEASGNRVGSKGVYNLTVTNEEGNVAGKVGNAFKSTGAGTSGSTSSAYLTIPNAAVNTLTEITWAGWYYFDTSFSSWSRIIDINKGANTSTFSVFIDASNSKLLLAGDSNAGQVIGTANGVLSLNVWHFIAATGSSGGREGGLFIWKASTQSWVSVQTWRSGTLTGDPKFYPAAGTVSSAYIGRSAYSTDGVFKGYVDQCGLWSRVLSMGELNWLVNGGSGRAYADIGTTTVAPSLATAAKQRVRPTYSPVNVLRSEEDYLPQWGVLYPRYTPQKN